MKIGMIREGKIPTDARVPLSPKQCRALMELYPQIEISVQPSAVRCFKDYEYREQKVPLVEDLSFCDILLGVKEVPADQLIAGKTYFFFSHTIKKQEHNRKLLQNILDKKIRLIDWETLTDENDNRVIAFGRWAGIVGAHNGIMTWLNRQRAQVLMPMHACKNLKEAAEYYNKLNLGPIKILVTGTGRVSSGAVEVLDMMGIRNVTVDEYLHENFDEPVYTQLNNSHMFYKPGTEHFDNIHYHHHPQEYRSKMLLYTRETDIFINGIYWDKTVPKFFTKEDMKSPGFKVKVIADITCDIAPDASVPSTLRSSTIQDPVYGYDPLKEIECLPYKSHSIDIMAVDNLPNELPRDASKNFGDSFIERIVPPLIKAAKEDILIRGTIAEDGHLTENFLYLTDYVKR